METFLMENEQLINFIDNDLEDKIVIDISSNQIEYLIDNLIEKATCDIKLRITPFSYNNHFQNETIDKLQKAVNSKHLRFEQQTNTITNESLLIIDDTYILHFVDKDERNIVVNGIFTKNNEKLLNKYIQLN